MKNWFRHITLLLAIAPLMLLGQSLPHTNEAAKHCQAKNFEASFAEINLATASPTEQNDAYTWYVKGFVFKEFYKEKEQGQINSKARIEALEALEKSMKLDVAGKHTANIKSAMKFLASSYFNDALKRSKEVDVSNQEEVFMLFSQFRKWIRSVEVATDLIPFEIQVLKSLGGRHYKLWELNNQNSDEYNAAVECFQKSARLAPMDCQAQYNLAILNYNNAVYKIKRIDANSDIMQLIIIQDESVTLFKKALPFMEKAIEICPSNADYYRGFMFMQRALGHETEYESLKKQLEEGLKTGKIKAAE
jgi:tetratricopeptide (TPR) repeat protein